jgi:hypothetical protein
MRSASLSASDHFMSRVAVLVNGESSSCSGPSHSAFQVGQLKILDEFFGGQVLFGQLGHGWEIHEQFLSFEKQKKHLAKLHEVHMVDLPTFDHSRPPVHACLSVLCRLATGPIANPRNRDAGIGGTLPDIGEVAAARHLSSGLWTGAT